MKRALGFAVALTMLQTTVAFAVSNSSPEPAKTQTLSIASKVEGPADYPPGAAAKGEEGAVIVTITNDNGTLKATPLASSGFPDLDAASNDIALDYYKSGGTNGGTMIVIVWKLNPNDGKPVQFKDLPGH